MGEKKRYKCDALCIRYMEKECITEDEESGLCDQPYKYREIGDVADAAMDRATEELYNAEPPEEVKSNE